MSSNISIYNEDSLQALKAMQDKQFDLAIVDPPYGLNIAKSGSIGADKFTPKNWDAAIPPDEYFIELRRVSKQQIVWGGNYFPILWNKGCRGFICWNKLNHHDNRADIEMAWTSIDGLAKYVEYMWDGNRYGTKGNIKGVGKPTIRTHPTEKPVYLYKWLLDNYAKTGMEILDTHLGSGSIAVACYDLGYNLTAYEIDSEYYEQACKRLEIYKRQMVLW